MSNEIPTPKLAQVSPRHPLLAVFKPGTIALVICVIAAAAFLYFARKGPDADVSIVHLTVYPVHTTSSANMGQPGTLGQAETHDELYVLAIVKVQSRLKDTPLFLKDMEGSVTSAEGDQRRELAASASNVPRFFLGYPAMKSEEAAPLLRESTIAPLQSEQGLVLLHFPIDKATWDHRKSANITLSFYHQQPITVDIPADK